MWVYGAIMCGHIPEYVAKDLHNTGVIHQKGLSHKRDGVFALNGV